MSLYRRCAEPYRPRAPQRQPPPSTDCQQKTHGTLFLPFAFPPPFPTPPACLGSGVARPAMSVTRCAGNCNFVDGGHVLFCQHCGFQVVKLPPAPGYLEASNGNGACSAPAARRGTGRGSPSTLPSATQAPSRAASRRAPEEDTARSLSHVCAITPFTGYVAASAMGGPMPPRSDAAAAAAAAAMPYPKVRPCAPTCPPGAPTTTHLSDSSPSPCPTLSRTRRWSRPSR